LQLAYRDLMLTKKGLDRATLEPSAVSVENILSYARGLEVKH